MGKICISPAYREFVIELRELNPDAEISIDDSSEWTIRSNVDITKLVLPKEFYISHKEGHEDELTSKFRTGGDPYLAVKVISVDKNTELDKGSERC